MIRPKLLFFITEDWYFWSHRLPLAQEAKRRGFEVLVMTRINQYGDKICEQGFRVISLNMQRRSTNLLRELYAIIKIAIIYHYENPDIVHQVGMKPVLYGSIAARIIGVRHVVNALAGLGYVFTSHHPKARLLRPIFKNCFRLLLNNHGSRLILQNKDDCELFIQNRLVSKSKIYLIRGSGVDTTVFHPIPENTGVPIVVFVSRMLKDKGVREFVEAARILKSRGVHSRFVLVGDTDLHNPASISVKQLTIWKKESYVELWGQRNDIPNVLAKSHIVCLPSYREGLPKSLLEAASSGRPIVASDTVGCREVVRHGENGFLVPVRSTVELADALQHLIENPELRRKMGLRGREIAVQEFAIEKVVAETMALYKEMLQR